MKFSTQADTQIVTGLRDGCVRVFDVDNAIEIAALKNHRYPVNQISFSSNRECLTASKQDAVIWDMKTWSMTRVLTLERDCIIKHIMFVPVSGDILVCFHDDIIHVWKNGVYDNFMQILPARWNKFSVKTIAATRYVVLFNNFCLITFVFFYLFIRNGGCVLIGGRSPFIVTFLLESWNLHQSLYLPNHIKSVKQMDFIPRLFDDGTSNFLCILAGSGIIYVYDMCENTIRFEIGTKREISSFTISNGGKYVACVLCTGEVFVHDVTQLLYCQNEKSIVTVAVKKKTKIVKSVQFKQLIQQEEVCLFLNTTMYSNIKETDYHKVVQVLNAAVNNRCRY